MPCRLLRHYNSCCSLWGTLLCLGDLSPSHYARLHPSLLMCDFIFITIPNFYLQTFGVISTVSLKRTSKPPRGDSSLSRVTAQKELNTPIKEVEDANEDTYLALEKPSTSFHDEQVHWLKSDRINLEVCTRNGKYIESPQITEEIQQTDCIICFLQAHNIKKYVYFILY